MNYTEALHYIHNINWQFCKPGLERTRELCESLGNPERELKFIHVAGTNGKGSFCAMLASILHAAGYKTGLYTSPFIRRFNERMQIDGESIGDEELAEITAYVRPFADALPEPPTEFELVSAIAFEYFRRNRCDVVVLEVGLGGRLDSTNVIEAPLLSVITGIDFDHTAFLGNTIEAIAKEKAGIIKNGAPCLYGGEDGPARRTVESVAQERHAPFYTVERDRLCIGEQTLDGSVFDFGELRNLQLPLLGTYQPYNAATVLSAVSILRERGLSVSEEAVRRGLLAVVWPARFELLNRDIPIIYDGGHNPQGVRAAVESIRLYFPERKVHLLCGVMADKKYDRMIETLEDVVAHAFAVCPGGERALSAEKLAEQFERQGVPATAYATVEEGVRAAISASRGEGVPLVCLGSLYLYSAASEAIQSLTATK